MKYIGKIPAEDRERTEALLNDGWQLLKEPPNIGITIAISLPFAFLLAGLAICWLRLLFPQIGEIPAQDSFQITFRIDETTIIYLLGIVLYTYFHEMIHALMIPGAVRSDKTYWGINSFMGFVYSEENFSKARFQLISVMPLLTLSFVVPAAMKLLGAYSPYLLALCVLNAAGSCVDVLNMLLIGFQVPRSGEITFNGMSKTFYRTSAAHPLKRLP